MSETVRPQSAANIDVAQTKYTDTNALIRFANRQFFRAIDQMLKSLEPNLVLDAGCGEGVVLGRIERRLGTGPFGMDLDLERLRLAKSERPERRLVMGDLHQLPFASDAFDVVLVLEVFEHVGDPPRALREVWRVSRSYLLASVPNEPFWRIGNMLRLKYLRQLGNTPEHIQHWTVWGFRRFVARLFSVTRLRTPFLWTFILARKSES